MTPHSIAIESSRSHCEACQVVKAPLACAADVHSGPLAHWIKSFEHLHAAKEAESYFCSDGCE